MTNYLLTSDPANHLEIWRLQEPVEGRHLAGVVVYWPSLNQAYRDKESLLLYYPLGQIVRRINKDDFFDQRHPVSRIDNSHDIIKGAVKALLTEIDRWNEAYESEHFEELMERWNPGYSSDRHIDWND